MQQTYLLKNVSFLFFRQRYLYGLIFGLWLLTSFAVRAEEIKLEAESATLTGVTVANSFAGFSGSGYVWEFDTDGDNVTFTFPAQAGQYKLNIQYTAPYGEKGYDLLVNSESKSGMFSATGEVFASVEAGTFQLVDGQNTITINKGWGYYGIDYLVLMPVVSNTIKLEGENATLNGVVVATTTLGYSGSGYVWEFDNDSDNLAFAFPAKAGEYELVIQYYSPYGEKGYGLQVNGVASDHMLTGTGEAFGSVTVGKFTLLEGQNSVTITKGWGYYGIDYIAFVPVSEEPPVIVPVVDGKAEAEEAALTGVSVATSPAGYSGAGYVTGFDDGTDKLTFNFTLTPGLYELSIGYTSPYGEKGYDVQVNDEKGSGMFPANTEFGVVKAGKFLLKEGMNSVTIGRGWGYFGIDYILLTPTSVPLPVKPPKTLADAQATNPTRSLFSYIVDLYGSKVLSGQQDDVDYILEKTGKEPAIGSFDLIEYSPSRIENGSNPTGTSERYIDWAKKAEGNGILSLMWHWNAPTDLLNEEPDKLWWSGFYTRATTFDLAAVLADKSGERYGLLIRDIDSIAVQLKKFRDANIPVLWRPLHEAPGGWFWWGAKGPEPFKELWRILYDRLTNHHDLHNLIWVYTGTTDINWYPGDAYVDIVGPDIYTDASANLSGDWAGMQELFNGKKLVALTETGNLPVPDKIRGYATWWSWFSVWTGDDYIKKQPIELLQAVYTDQDVITRDELPDWRNYGAPTAALTSPTNQSSFYACQSVVLKANASDAEGSVVKVTFRANGQVIGTDTNAGDGWQLNWTGATPGTYSVTAEATDNEGFTRLSAPVSLTLKADDQAPVVTVSSAKTVLGSPNHQYYTLKLSNIGLQATDNCGGTLDPKTIRIKQVNSDEAVNAPNSGNTNPDIVISADCRSVNLRNERVGTGNGRVYTVVVEATDAAGNAGLASYTVEVPVGKNQTAQADATAYTVYSTCGTASNTRITSTHERIIDATEEVTVYPNPANGTSLTVQIEATTAQPARLALVNAVAQEVVSLQHNLAIGTNRVEIPLTHTQDGIYLLVVNKADGPVTRKVIIRK